MRGKTVMFDEGYGDGEQPYTFTGITVDEMIEILQGFSNNGMGDMMLFDSWYDTIEGIKIEKHYMLDEDIVVIG